MNLKERLIQYAYLIRLDKPIGTLLLLWPTYWALWIASQGKPTIDLIVIFTLGTCLMRSAGCAVNDYADNDFDRFVKRTQNRPLTSGKISKKETLIIAGMLSFIAFMSIQSLNQLTIQLSFLALAIAIIYPFTKRFFSIPQAILGVAFGFGIPMAYAAVLDRLPGEAWLMLIANIFWAIAYDTAYAMVDRDDDVKLGLKTSAITFGQHEVKVIAFCYFVFLSIMASIGYQSGLNIYYWIGLLGALLCSFYHITLVMTRDRMKCFKAFRHNNWLGASIFLGILAAYQLKTF
ncbi:MAG: 4-hydroxybenzoate octaprenyltransferase [Betaproteobacteria bacterium]|jgi:4-hydroxybenzoate polyprenyltransferase